MYKLHYQNMILNQAYMVQSITSCLADLSNMYKLLKPIHGGLGVLIQDVEGHIKQTGMEAVKSLKGDNVSKYGGPPPSPPPKKQDLQ